MLCNLALQVRFVCITHEYARKLLYVQERFDLFEYDITGKLSAN